MPGASRRNRHWWTPTEVVAWCVHVPFTWNPDKRRREVEARTKEALFKLGVLCCSGKVRTEWRATHVPGGESYHYEPSDAFEATPPVLWNDDATGARINFIWRSDTPDKVNLVVGGAFTRFAMNPVEALFRRADVEREFPKSRPPSRLKSWWPEVREQAFDWMEEHDPRQQQPGYQADLEKHVTRYILDKDYQAVTSTIRVHVARWIKEYKETVL